MNPTTALDFTPSNSTVTSKLPVLDFGVKVPPIEELRPKEGRKLSPIEMLGYFDRKEALKIAYIPHFLTQCVLHYIDMFADYATANKVTNHKQHTRLLKALRDDYYQALREEMPADVYGQFLKQRIDYLANCSGNLYIMYLTARNQLLKGSGDVEHDLLYCVAYCMRAIVRYVEKFDNDVNGKISKKVGRVAHNNGDARLSTIGKVCDDILCGITIEDDPKIDLCIKIMENDGLKMILRMIE